MGWLSNIAAGVLNSNAAIDIAPYIERACRLLSQADAIKITDFRRRGIPGGASPWAFSVERLKSECGNAACQRTSPYFRGLPRVNQ